MTAKTGVPIGSRIGRYDEIGWLLLYTRGFVTARGVRWVRAFGRRERSRPIDTCLCCLRGLIASSNCAVDVIRPRAIADRFAYDVPFRRRTL